MLKSGYDGISYELNEHGVVFVTTFYSDTEASMCIHKCVSVYGFAILGQQAIASNNVLSIKKWNNFCSRMVEFWHADKWHRWFNRRMKVDQDICPF